MEIIDMNKLIATIFFTFFIYTYTNAQTENVGVGTNTPDNSAVLHVSFQDISGPKGLLIPRMTSAQRDLIPSPANGLLIFNVDSNQFEYNSSGTWLPLLSNGNIALNSGNILVGDATNVAASVALSGDAVIDNAGLLTVQDDAVDGTDISIAGEANGAMAYHNGTDWIVLTPGNNGDVLAMNLGLPEWQADDGISSTLTAGNILVGDATNVAASVTMSGDLLITEAGVTEIQDDAVDGTDISISDEANGAITYHNGTDWITLAPGTDGQYLSLASGVPVWADVSGGGSLDDAYSNGATITLTGASGSVVVSGALDSDAALELSNTGANGLALQVNSGLSRFGNVYTPTQASGDGDLIVDNVLEVGGQIYATGLPLVTGMTWPMEINVSTGEIFRGGSSRRYKTDIKNYKYDYNNILKADVKEYIMKSDKEKIKRIGLIAEELDSLGLTKLVVYDTQNRPDAVRYDRVALYLLEVMKKQQKEIEMMKEEIETLKSKVK